MSAAILYHVQGIRKYALRKISIKKDIFIFECFWRHPEELKCAGCRSGNVRRKVPMGNLRTRIHAEIPRVHCLDCGKVAQIHIGLARPNVRYTRYFERFVRDLLQGMTCQDAAGFARSRGTRFTPSKKSRFGSVITPASRFESVITLVTSSKNVAV